jgi:hypothetical protein
LLPGRVEVAFIECGLSLLILFIIFHSIWCQFKIPFCLVLPIVFSFWAYAFYFFFLIHTPLFMEWHGSVTLITAIWTHLQMFLNSKFYHFMFKCWILLSRCQGAWTVICTWKYRPLTGSSIKPF